MLSKAPEKYKIFFSLITLTCLYSFVVASQIATPGGSVMGVVKGPSKAMLKM